MGKDSDRARTSRKSRGRALLALFGLPALIFAIVLSGPYLLAGVRQPATVRIAAETDGQRSDNGLGEDAALTAPAATTPEGSASESNAAPVTATMPLSPSVVWLPLAVDGKSEGRTLSYHVDRSAAPPLPYDDLTLLVSAGRAGVLEVRGDGAPVDYQYDVESGTVQFTTAASDLEIVLHDPAGGASGNVTIAPLKDNRAWAWSHGFDDNVNLRPAIDLFRQSGWRATLFLIAREIDDHRDEQWIADAPYLQALLAEGWSIGNHTWDHSCVEDSADSRTVTRAQRRLEEIVARSSRPEYPVTAFAAPCFSRVYDTILAELQASGETSLLFNESGNDYYIAVAPGAGSYSDGPRHVTAFGPPLRIGRSPAIELGLEEALAEFDWVAQQAAAGRSLWFNTFSHGNREETLAELLPYLHATYGPGGSDTLWVAPSDEISSYLRLRDVVVISRR
jgi:peptidoglycan/xylan/chitin deacetylase (PgdA/CDA1 family)